MERSEKIPSKTLAMFALSQSGFVIPILMTLQARSKK